MTPFRMRLLVVAFLAIATGITVNAIYFQEGPRLAASTVRQSGKRTASTTPAKASAPTKASAPVAAAVPNVTAALPPAKDALPAQPEAQAAAAPHSQPAAPPAKPPVKPAEPPQPSPLVRSIQKKLAQLGFKSVPQDGLLNPETRAAILAVEFEQGRPLTGEAAEPVLTALYFLEASGRTRFSSSDNFEHDRKLVSEVQDLLAKLGYSSGPVDGQLDAKTREAIRKFESDRRMKAAGKLTDRVLLEMLLERGKPFLSKG